MNLFQKIFALFFPHKLQFAKFFVIGLSTVGLDMALLSLFSQGGVWPPLVVALTQPLLFLYNFLLNKYWAFGSKINGQKQLLKYLLLVGLNYGVSFGSMYLFQHIFGFHYLMVRLVTIGVVFPLNFLAYKYWVYR